MRHRPFSLLLVTPFVFACQGIPRSDPHWDRQELEVRVQVDPQISDLLRTEGDAHALEAVVSETVFGLADVGLRFYPVPSESYEEEQPRPDFLLTVQLQDVGAEQQGSTVASPTARSQSGLERIRCTIAATLLKRRPDGPPLIVGMATGRGEAKAQEASAGLSSMREFELDSTTQSLVPVHLRAADLRASVEEAVTGALRGLVAPIDREFHAPE